jgi:hypothetical protein
MITGADAPSKHAPLLPVHLNEKVGRLVEVLEQLPFNSRANRFPPPWSVE